MSDSPHSSNATTELSELRLQARLREACSVGDVALVAATLAAGADANYTSATVGYALVSAARGGHSSVVAQLLAAGADPSVGVGAGTPLVAASEGGHVPVAEMLLLALSDPRADATYALRAAAARGHLLAVRLLLEAGADTGGCDGTGENALMLAALQGRDAVVEELVPRMDVAGVRASNQRGRTALHSAVQCCSGAAVSALLDAGADITAKDSFGMTPLVQAGMSLDAGAVTAIARQAVLAGVDIDAPGHGGMTALSCAASRGNRVAVEALIPFRPRVMTRTLMSARGTPMRSPCIVCNGLLARAAVEHLHRLANMDRRSALIGFRYCELQA